MPYIAQDKRQEVEPEFLDRFPETPGELNYVISSIVNGYLQLRAESKGNDNPKYYDYNEAIGALQCAQLELYRRLVAPYEDDSIKRNGDVY